MQWSDVHVSFRAMVWPEANPETTETRGLPDRLAAQKRGKGIVSTRRWAGTRWAVVRIPTRHWAQQIDADPVVLLDEFFAGALDDWSTAVSRWQSLAKAVDDGDVVTISAPDTELRLGISGRRGVLFAGEANLPDGELATAPVDDEVDGYIAFPGVTVFAGQIFENLRFEFERGRTTAVTADQGEDMARALIGTDGGSDRVGELGIGLSSVVKQWTGDLFIDEKILCTVHLALGRAYPQCGGINESTLHWDIVKDLRTGAPSGPGTLLIDNTPVIDEGRVVWPGLI